MAYHQQLLVVLFAKHGHPAPGSTEYTGKQFHHHRAYAREKTRAKVPFQDVCQLRVGLHFESLWLGV